MTDLIVGHAGQQEATQIQVGDIQLVALLAAAVERLQHQAVTQALGGGIIGHLLVTARDPSLAGRGRLQ